MARRGAAVRNESELMSAYTRPLSSLQLIDVHHHVVLPEYEQALIRSGAGDPSRPFRRNDGPQVVCEKMAELGIAGAVLNPLSVAGVHHGDDADARHLTRSVNEALAKFASGAPERLGFFATLPVPDVDGAVREMAHALDALHADGVVLLSHQNGVYVGDPRCEPLYAEMNRRGVVCFVHPTIPPYFPGGLDLRMWPAYVEYAFDTTRVASLRDLTKWIDGVRDSVGPIPVYALGNKTDLTHKREVTPEEASSVLRSYECPILYTSAKTGDNVEQAFQGLAKTIVESSVTE